MWPRLSASATGLVVVNLGLVALDVSWVPAELKPDVVERRGDHQVDAVLKALDERPDVERLVICIRRRTPVGKAVMGSVSQQLLLQVDLPVLTVKLPGRG